MPRKTTNRLLSTTPVDSARILLVGSTQTAKQAMGTLEPEGFTTMVANSADDALDLVVDRDLDLILVGQQETTAFGDTELVRRLHGGPGRQPSVLVLGSPQPHAEGDNTPAIRSLVGAQYIHPDVGVPELVEEIRSTLGRRLESAPLSARQPLSTPRMAEEIDRELQRSAIAVRPGMLAAVGVAELERIRARFGAQGEQLVREAFDELFAQDARVLEQHSVGSDGEFLLLMPETDVVSGRLRLRALSRRIAGTVLDIGGEQVRMTPIIGFATFAGTSSRRELVRQAVTAVNDACLHLDLVPVQFSPGLISTTVPVTAQRDRLLALAEWLRNPLQIAFSLGLLLSLPFIIYVLVWNFGFDLTRVTYPLVSLALAGTTTVLWIESFRAVGTVEVPPEETPGVYPVATAVVAAYLPNEAATIVDTVQNMLSQDYPGEMQIILAYNTPQHLPVEETLAEIAAGDPRLELLRVQASTSKAQNVNAALAHVRGEFVGVFDADHHPAPGSFLRAWRWLSNGHDIVQGHCVVRNGPASWVSRLVAVEFETIYAVSHPGRARLHGFGIFGGSNGYWRTEALRQIRMQGSMLTEDIDSSMRSLRDGLKIVSDPGLRSSELAPTTVTALWNQRMRWAQGWTQTAQRHLLPAMRSDRLSGRQRLGAAFLLGWTQIVPWVTIQILPILAFTAWRVGGFTKLNWLIPLFVLLSLFTFSVGIAQTAFAYVLGDPSIKRHRGWFFLYALHSVLWFGEFKNLIARVAQIKEVIGERQWRVTPRSVPTTTIVNASATAASSEESLQRSRAQ